MAKEKSISPSEAFRLQMPVMRDRKQPRWSQEALAAAVSELGEPMHQATVAKIESGTRGISLDDAMGIAAALGVSPVHMVAASFLQDVDRVAVAPKLPATTSLVRGWMRGQSPLREQDARFFFTEVSEEEWLAQQQVGLQAILSMVQDLIEAVVADDRDRVADLLDGIYQEVQRQRAALERRNKRGQ